jgi:chromosomal replication initiator protein
MEEFRARYRELPDVLLIDDIQFLSNKDSSQDEFFHTFNALHHAHKQIVLTCDKLPGELPGLEDRLRSRFTWGLIAEIGQPDLETRVAILKRKAESENLILPDDVALYLGAHVKSNVRELEGALLRVSTFADLKSVPITEAFVREVIGDTGRDRPMTPVTVDQVQKAVAAHFALRIADLKGPRRHKGIARPRMIAMYLCRELTGSSYPEIGLRFGGKDHSTVINACRRMQEIQQDDPELRATIETLRTHLTHVPASREPSPS